MLTPGEREIPSLLTGKERSDMHADMHAAGPNESGLVTLGDVAISPVIWADVITVRHTLVVGDLLRARISSVYYRATRWRRKR